LIFCNPGLKNCWHGGLGIEPTTLDLSQVTMTSQPWRTLGLWVRPQKATSYLIPPQIAEKLIVSWSQKHFIKNARKGCANIT